MSSLAGQAGPADESTEPLSPQEREQVQRLLSDPFSYPQSFKTWLVSFLESSDLNLTPNAILGLVDLIKKTPHTTSVLRFFGARQPGIEAAPGVLIAYAGSAQPPGTLVCNGIAVSRSTYADLFAAIGTTYGAGNGSTTFNLPDMTSVHPPVLWLISY